ncbi:MAG: hypothetical protein WA188_09945 [Terriglobales bacterium]
MSFMSLPTWLENGVRNNLWNLAISLAVSLIFFGAARRRAMSAYSERRKRAHDEIVRIVETRLVNGVRINAAELNAFIRAVCRQYDVSPQGSLTNASVLEDVRLRIESSPHLNAQQKTEYAARVAQPAPTGNGEVTSLPVAPTLVKLVGRLRLAT